ncbi:MAG: radical SAM protein [Dehalococcoidales bacterium]|nr:radical SAM protein [Dehalococcoidales bacterium]
MTIKEFIVTKSVKLALPIIGGMSDKNLGRFFSLASKAAPTKFTKSFMIALNKLREDKHPIIEMLRRAITRTNPHIRNRLMNSILVKHHWYGSVKRDEMRSQGLAVPGTFLISPTMRCNLHCTGCYAANYSTKDDLESEVIDRVLNEAEELGIFWITILGGEPFIREDMWEIYKKHQNIFFQIFTNGTLLDKNTTKKIAELGNILVVFSLDGFEQETDSRRGQGVFQKVMEGMDLLRESGVPFGFSYMITRKNVNTIISDQFSDMLVEKGCLIGWNFLYMPVGPNPDATLMPTPEQRELIRTHGPQRIRNKKPIFTIDFWNDAPYMGGCIAGARHFFHINSHGDVEPCIFIHMATDNIHDKSLKEVINSPYFKAFRSRQPYGENLLRPCTVIDHPHVLREIYNTCQPYPTDSPICELITSPLSDALDNYSQKVASILDPAWNHEFANFNFTPDTFAPGNVQEKD